MIVALFDIDGVVVPEGELVFAHRLERDHGIPHEDIEPFFIQDFYACLTGRASVRERLRPYVEDWQWEGDVDDLLHYWFEAERKLDERVLAFVQDLKDRGVKVCIASNQFQERADYLLDEVGLRQVFDEYFFSSSLGHIKAESEYFKKVLNALDVSPSSVVFWDDVDLYVVRAREAGIDGRLYSGFEDMKRWKEETYGKE